MLVSRLFARLIVLSFRGRMVNTSETDTRGPPNLIGCIETACKSTRQKAMSGRSRTGLFASFIHIQVAAGPAGTLSGFGAGFSMLFLFFSPLSRGSVL
jgi:hypothetical protein